MPVAAGGTARRSKDPHGQEYLPMPPGHCPLRPAEYRSSAALRTTAASVQNDSVRRTAPGRSSPALPRGLFEHLPLDRRQVGPVHLREPLLDVPRPDRPVELEELL